MKIIQIVIVNFAKEAKVNATSCKAKLKRIHHDN